MISLSTWASILLVTFCHKEVFWHLAKVLPLLSLTLCIPSITHITFFQTAKGKTKKIYSFNTHQNPNPPLHFPMDVKTNY